MESLKKEQAAQTAAAAPENDETGKRTKVPRWVRQIFPAVIIVISVVWICKGLTEFGFFNPLKGGTPAFLPVICAGVMLVCGILALIKSFQEEMPEFHLLCFIFLLLGGAIIYAAKLIGLLPALLLFVFIWIKVVEKGSWKGSLLLVALMALIGYGLFQALLHVPFPQGWIVDTFLR